jgi:hypothetical protein
MTTPSEDDYQARVVLIELMCRADPDETIPLEMIVRMARTILDAGFHRPEPEGDG